MSGPVHTLVSGDGPPVVLVPGFGDPTAMWAPLMGELPRFRFHAVDRPRFGLTGGAEYRAATFRRLSVDFLEQVIDALGLDRPLFIGNLIGSLWMLWLAMDRPDRVRGMVHSGCPAFVLGTSAPLPMRLLSIRPLGRLIMRLDPPSRAQVRRFAKMAGVDLSENEALQDLLVKAQRLPGVRESILELLGAVVGLRGPGSEHVVMEDQLSRVRQPTQIIWGAQDPFGSVEVGRRMASALPEAELQVVPDGGHLPWVGHSAEVAGHVRPFLRRNPG